MEVIGEAAEGEGHARSGQVKLVLLKDKAKHKYTLEALKTRWKEMSRKQTNKHQEPAGCSSGWTEIENHYI